MGNFYQDWDAGWAAETTANLDGTGSIAANSSVAGAAVSNDLRTYTEVSVTVAYGATAADATVYVLRDVDGTNFEAIADKPFGVTIPGVASTTIRRTFTVPASVSRFKVAAFNPAANSAITVTVRYRQAVGTTTA
jgi:hypothetical protein